MKKIFIITRKQFKEDGIGKNSDSVELTINNFLKEYWINSYKDYILDEISNEINSLEDLAFYYDFNKNDYQYDTIDSEFLATNHNDLNPKNDEIFNLLKQKKAYLKVFLYNDIYIYHNLQAGEIPDIAYFEALRKFSVDHYCIQNETKEEDIEVNWLVHGSTDFALNDSVDAFLYGKGGLIKNGNLINSSPVLKNTVTNNLFKNDNFWNFIHSEGTNGIYDKYIIAVNYKNADELYKCLFYDEDEMIYHAELLKQSGLLDKKSNFNIKDPVYKPFLDYYRKKREWDTSIPEIKKYDEIVSAINTLLKDGAK